MDKQAIEILAVNAVRDSIAISEYLSPYINDNDKEPTWDGKVYIFNDKSKKKSKMRGYVPVQVKGKECNSLTKENITYPVSTVDMKNFLYDGGAIFFVVYISSDGNQRKIYYTTLSPVKLKLYLKESKKQKLKSLPFKAFPTENDRKATIFLNFFIDSKKQTSFATTGILSLEELEKKEAIQNLSLSVTGYGYSQADIHKALFENEIYMYAEIKGSAIPIPIDLIPDDIQTQELLHNKVSVNGNVYYNTITRIRNKNQIVTKIGNSFSITYDNDSNNIKFDFKSAPMLRDRVKDYEFIISALKFQHFYIINTKVDLVPILKQIENFNLEQIEKKLDYFKKILSVFDILNIKRDIEIERMTERDYREMYNLILAFSDKKPVPNLKKDLPPVCRIIIQDIKLMLVFEKNIENENTYNIYDFFKSNLVLFYELDGSDEKNITSQYSILQKDDYLSLDNIDYNTILPSYKSLQKKHPEIIDRANNDMLIMLTAYDEGNSKDKKLLKLAKDFANWILNEDKGILPIEIKLINYLQIIRRERELNIDEVKKLCLITENKLMSEEIKTGAYLLLGNQLAAEVHFFNLESELQETFKKYPIFKFWNKFEEKK